MNIKLLRDSWEIDTGSPLGEAGGFGEVFRGIGSDTVVAIKRLKLTATEAAYRELNIAESLLNRDLSNVIPIHDYGQDADSDRYFIVMPLCDRSLQREIIDRGRLPPTESLDILIAILSGLSEVTDITHRDLKPANILLHDGAWKIADFGIAKFVEDSTSLQTLRNSLTPAYGAPEQWLVQRPSPATDIYAAGCIAHALLNGEPPFSGDVAELREHHLNTTPAQLAALPAPARSIVQQMLRKNPDIRPSLARCLSVFDNSKMGLQAEPPQNASKIAEAVSDVAQEQAAKEAKEKEHEHRRNRRKAILDEAMSDLHRICGRLFAELEHHAGDVIEHRTESRIHIGNAQLVLDATLGGVGSDGFHACDSESHYGDEGWGVHRKQSTWDLISYGNMVVRQRVGHNEYVRCANLVFGKPDEESEYRWYEMAFFSITGQKIQDSPFCLSYPWEIDEVLSNVMGVNQLAYPPKPIDGEDEDGFIEYWIEIIAQAMIGQMNPPRSLPMSR